MKIPGTQIISTQITLGVILLLLMSLSACERAGEREVLQNELSSARAELQELRTQLGELENELAAARAGAQSLNAQATTLDRASAALSDDSQGVGALRARAGELETQTTAFAEDQRRLNRELGAARSELGGLQDQLRAVSDERDDLLTRLSQLRAANVQQEANLEGSDAVDATRGAAAEAARDAARREVEALGARNEELRALSSELATQLNESRRLVTQAKEEVGGLTETQTTLQQELTSTRNEPSGPPGRGRTPCAGSGARRRARAARGAQCRAKRPAHPGAARRRSGRGRRFASGPRSAAYARATSRGARTGPDARSGAERAAHPRGTRGSPDARTGPRAGASRATHSRGLRRCARKAPGFRAGKRSAYANPCARPRGTTTATSQPTAAGRRAVSR